MTTATAAVSQPPVPAQIQMSAPHLPDAPGKLIQADGHLCRMLPPSQMFIIKKGLALYSQAHPDGETYDASQGDGGASLGGIPREELVEALHRFLPRANTTGYGTPQGDRRVREAILANYYRVGTDVGLTPDNVVLAAGGRDALQKWYQSIALLTGRAGDCLLAGAAPWISYAHGSYLSGLNLLCAPSNGAGFRITPEAVDESVAFARAHDLNVRALVITTPDNPTGTFYSERQVVELVERAVERGIEFVMLDLMYQAVLDEGTSRYDARAILSRLGTRARRALTLMDGLTKSAGASNVRHAHLVCGDKRVADAAAAIASHTVLPCVLGEAAAFEVYGAGIPDDHQWVRRIVEPTSHSRTLFRARMAALGYRFVADQGYYAFVDVGDWIGCELPPAQRFADPLGRPVAAIKDTGDLTNYLTVRHGLAVVPGHLFYAPGFIRFSLAQHPRHTQDAVERLHAALHQIA